MKGFKSTVALLLVLVGLGAYIYWVVPDADSVPDRTHVFESIEPDTIVEMTLTAESGEVTTLDKEDDTWRITSPVSALASSPEATSLTTTLESLELVRVVEESPSDLTQYGLAPPRMEIAFKSSGDDQSDRLSIGSKTPTGDNLYAMRNGEAPVFLIPSFQESSLNRSTFDLREKSIVRFTRDQVNGLTIEAPEGDFRLAKEDTDWFLAQPSRARADSSAVEGLIGRLETTQMKSVANEESTADDLKTYGLEVPEASITLDGTDTTLLVGADAGSDTTYAKNAASPVVFTMDTSLADDLKRGATDYRRRDIFDFRAYNATRVLFTRDDQEIVFERVPAVDADSQDTWRRVSPNPAEVDKAAVDALLVGLVETRAVDFVSSIVNTGLDRPLLSVLVTFDDGKREERASFGRQGESAYAARADEAGAALIESAKLDESIERLEALIQ